MVRGPVSIIFSSDSSNRSARAVPPGALALVDRALAQKVLVAVLALVGIFLLIKARHGRSARLGNSAQTKSTWRSRKPSR